MRSICKRGKSSEKNKKNNINRISNSNDSTMWIEHGIGGYYKIWTLFRVSI